MTRGHRNHRPAKGETLAERVWRTCTAGLAHAPAHWFDYVERFVEDTRPANPELTCAALLLALDNARDADGFFEGSWIHLLPAHVYVHAEVPGLGGTRALGVAERFVRWICAEEDLHGWDERRLLYLLDQARSSVGAKPRGAAPARDRCVRLRDLPRLADAFRASPASSGLPEELLVPAIRIAGLTSVAPGTRLVRFGALDVHELALLMAEAARGEPDPVNAAFGRAVTAVLAAFYRWLGETERLEPSRAAEIAQGLARMRAMAAVPAGPTRH